MYIVEILKNGVESVVELEQLKYTLTTYYDTLNEVRDSL